MEATPMLTKREVSQLNLWKANIKVLWNAACTEAGVPVDSKFVVFDQSSAACKAHNEAMAEFHKGLARIRKNEARRERHATLKSLGLS
jgi:hypothetical protein